MEIVGFANEFTPLPEIENENLSAPVLHGPEEQKTSDAIWLKWTKILDAASYEMLVDGRLYTMGNACSYLHDELEYHSEHTYRVRARNEKGYSPWSDEIRVSTLLDPWRNEIGVLGTIT